MPYLRRDETAARTNQINIFFYYTLWYYAAVNMGLFVAIFHSLQDEGTFLKMVQSPGFFKFLFVIFSILLIDSLIVREEYNKFGPGTSYICGLYFAILTALVYYKIIVTVWYIYTESTDDIRPNLYKMVLDVGPELDQLIKGPLRDPIDLAIALLIIPTPVLGIVVQWFSFEHYSNLTKYVPEKEEPVRPGRKRKKGKSKYY